MTPCLRLLAVLALVFLPLGARSATLLHAFEFHRDLSNATGGTAFLTPGSTEIATSRLIMGPNGGPKLSMPDRARSYTLEMKFSLNSVSGWNKLMDFRTLASDGGLYVVDGGLNFFNGLADTGTGFLSALVDHVLVLSRNDSTKSVNLFLDGQLLATFADPLAQAQGSNGGRFVYLFQDDNTTGQTQATGGTLDYLRIYNVPLTPEEIEEIDVGFLAAVPLPASLHGMGAALAGLWVFARRRRKPA